MSNSKFYLFRHGLAVKPGHDYKDTIVTASLLPEGKADVIKLANKFKKIDTDLNICSEYLRCQQTAAIVTQITGKKFITDPRVNEFHPRNFTKFKNRIQNFLNDVQSQNKKNILISTHGAVIAAITHLLKEGDFKPKHELDYPREAGLRVISSS